MYTWLLDDYFRGYPSGHLEDTLWKTSGNDLAALIPLSSLRLVSYIPINHLKNVWLSVQNRKQKKECHFFFHVLGLNSYLHAVFLPWALTAIQ